MKTAVSKQGLGITALTALVYCGLYIYISPYLPGQSADPASIISLDTVLSTLPLKYDTLHVLMVCSLSIINGILLTHTAARNMITGGRNYLPFLFYILLSISIFPDNVSLDVLAGAFFVIAGIARYSSTYSTPSRPSGRVFTAGIMWGIALLFSPLYALMVLFLPFVMFKYRHNSKLFVVGLTGTILPVFIFSYISWLSGSDFLLAANILLKGSQLRVPTADLTNNILLAGIIASGLFLVVCFMSIAVFMRRSSQMRTRGHIFIICMFVLTLISFASVGLEYQTGTALPFIAVPASICCSYYFETIKGKFSLAVYTTLLLSVIAVYFVRLAPQLF